MQSTDEPHVAAPASAHAEVPGKHAEAEHGGGMPQFQFSNWPGQVLWLLVIFVVLLIAMSRMLKRLRGAIDARAETISNALAEARALRDEAEAQAKAAEADLNEARAKAQRTAADAKAKAKAEAAARQAEDEARLAVQLGEAEVRIRKSRDKAMKSVAGIAADTAQALVEKLVGEAPDAAAAEAAVAKARA